MLYIRNKNLNKEELIVENILPREALLPRRQALLGSSSLLQQLTKANERGRER
jgi:hypothetical protein